MLSIPLHELNVLFPPTCVFLLVRECSVPSILSLRIRDEEGEWGGGYSVQKGNPIPLSLGPSTDLWSQNHKVTQLDLGTSHPSVWV